MISKHKLLISEDQTIIKAGLRALLSRERDLEVIGEADNSQDTLRMVSELSPELILMNFNIHGVNGTETIAEIRNRHPETRILVLTYQNSEESIREALQAGANGYILKDANRAELVTAVRCVLAGKVYLSPSISDKVINAFLVGMGEMHSARPHLNALTERERQILKMIAEGSTNRCIAEYLGLSVKTVDKHRSNLMRKLNLHNVSALTTFAIGQGLVNMV